MICAFCGNVTENRRAVSLYMRAARITYIDCPECCCALSMSEIRAAVREQRYNHNHDSKGRFCSGSGAGDSAQGLDKSPKSGIIESGSDPVALENQRYGRNKSTLVNKTYIESGEYRRKYDINVQEVV